jgi:hypothetical protein
MQPCSFASTAVARKRRRRARVTSTAPNRTGSGPMTLRHTLPARVAPPRGIGFRTRRHGP